MGSVRPERWRLFVLVLTLATCAFPVGMHVPFRWGPPPAGPSQKDAPDGPVCRHLGGVCCPLAARCGRPLLAAGRPRLDRWPACLCACPLLAHCLRGAADRLCCRCWTLTAAHAESVPDDRALHRPLCQWQSFSVAALHTLTIPLLGPPSPCGVSILSRGAQPPFPVGKPSPPPLLPPVSMVTARASCRRGALASAAPSGNAAAVAASPAPPSTAGRRVGRAGCKRGADGPPLAGEPPAGRRRSARVRGQPPELTPEAAPSPCRPACSTPPPPAATSAHLPGVRLGLLDLPTDLLLRFGGQLPPSDLFALAGSCKAARATFRRGAWVRLFECICLPTVAAPAKGAEVVSPATPAGAVGPPRQLVGPDREARRWHLGRHSFSAAAAEAEARRIVELIAALAAVPDEGVMVRVDLSAQFRMAVNVGWAVYNKLSLPLVLASSRVALPVVGPGTLVYHVLPINAARRFWHISDGAFASPPTTGVGAPSTAALSAELRTVGGLTRAAVRTKGSVSGLLKTASRIQARAHKIAERVAINRVKLDMLAVERRLHRFPGAMQVACDCVPTLKDFMAGRLADGTATQARVAAALDAVTAAYEALSPTFLWGKVMCQTGGSGLWLNERHQWSWPSCLRRCVSAPSGDATAIAVAYEKS